MRLWQATCGAVMVMDEQVKPFSRIWCLFELSRLKDVGQPLELICREGSLSKPDMVHNPVLARMVETTFSALSDVSILNAESSIEADKWQIWGEAVNKTARTLIAGLGAERFFPETIEIYGVRVLPSFFMEFDLYLRSLLATTMLQMMLAKEVSWLGSKVQSPAGGRSPPQFGLRHRAEGLADSGRMALHEAALSGQEAMAELLLEQKADVRARNNDGAAALRFAAFGGHQAELLLRHGADVKAQRNDGRTALHGAAIGGHQAMVELLLRHGADVRAQTNDGRTALHDAAIGGHQSMVELLLRHGADVRAQRNNGRTGLHDAAIGGHQAMVELLLRHGADVRAQRNDGRTALHDAAIGGHQAMVELLLRHGADVRAQTNDGRTALHDAAIGGHQAMVELLLRHGADVRAQRNEWQNSAA